MDPASLDAAGAGVGAIRVVLASLSGFACLAALQALALPRWPEAAPLAAPAVVASLGQAGLEVTPLSSRPGQRSSEFARGPQLAFLLRDGATTARLQLMPAQVRQRANFQLALISRDQPSLALPWGLPLQGDGGALAACAGAVAVAAGAVAGAVTGAGVGGGAPPRGEASCMCRCAD
jgi:hypothetical protein